MLVLTQCLSSAQTLVAVAAVSVDSDSQELEAALELVLPLHFADAVPAVL